LAGRLKRRGFTFVRQAFTLVELLVVIGIIALLISILMPALSAANAQAKTLRCGANLHALGHAMQQYANDFKGKIPRGYDYDVAYLHGHILWAEAISKYLGKPVEVRDLTQARDLELAKVFRTIEVYQCPVFPNEDEPLDYVANSWIGGTGGDDASIVLAKVPRSSEVIFLTEANAHQLTDVFVYHDIWDPSHLPVDEQGKPQPNARIMNDNRHRGKLNVLFLDGHVTVKFFKEMGRKDFDYLWTQ
jgi:prepilin-type processing-associated H-X9-DG protein/prepilin-type N-terminal cleavage/methylation domain-containing protein